jgi:hypothetical protein
MWHIIGRPSTWRAIGAVTALVGVLVGGTAHTLARHPHWLEHLPGYIPPAPTPDEVEVQVIDAACDKNGAVVGLLMVVPPGNHPAMAGLRWVSRDICGPHV